MPKNQIFVFDESLSDRQNFFLTKVLQKYWAYSSFKDIENPFAYIPVRDIITILGNSYKEQISPLIEMDLIKTIPLQKSKWGAETTGFIPIKTNFKKKEAKEKAIDAYYLKKEETLTELHRSVFKALSRFKIHTTTQEFRNVVNGAYLKHETRYNNKEIKRKKTKREFKTDYSLLWNSIQLWNNATPRDKLEFVSIDDFGYRFHTIFSRLPKELRSAIRLNNQKLVELDLAQSQPTILATILQERIPNNSFSNLIFSGEYIYDVLGKTKESGRKAFNYSVFGKDIDKRFSKLFPDVVNEIDKMKYQRIPNNPSNKHYSNLACLLQRKESEMFSNLWNNLLKRRIPFIPIHDSILVTEKDFNNALTCFTKSMNKYVPLFNINFKHH
jgi:hypothetical protein